MKMKISFVPKTGKGEKAEAQSNGDLEITIHNVVAAYNIGCRLDLHRIGSLGINVVYKSPKKLVRMELREPAVTANIYASGKINVNGACSLAEAKVGGRRVARSIQKLGYSEAHLYNYRITNIIGITVLPFPIRLEKFATKYRSQVGYESEMHSGAVARHEGLKTTIKIYRSGKLVVTGLKFGQMRSAVAEIMPKIEEFYFDRSSIQNC